MHTSCESIVHFKFTKRLALTFTKWYFCEVYSIHVDIEIQHQAKVLLSWSQVKISPSNVLKANSHCTHFVEFCQISVLTLSASVLHLFSLNEHVESPFIGSWNVWEVTDYNRLAVGIGLCLLVQCELALRSSEMEMFFSDGHQ